MPKKTGEKAKEARSSAQLLFLPLGVSNGRISR